MSEYKKTMQPIIDLLEANKNAKVGDILAEVQILATAKARSTGQPRVATSLRNDNGEVVAIRCYYFKAWMPIVTEDAVEFGAKSNNKTGFNTMSKLGNSLWTKQQAEAKKSAAQLLSDVEEGIVEPQNISTVKAEIETVRNEVAKVPKGIKSFTEMSEVKAFLGNNGHTFSEPKDTDEDKPKTNSR